MQSVRMMDDEFVPVQVGQDTVDAVGNATGIKLDGPPTAVSADESIIRVDDAKDSDDYTFNLVAVGPLSAATIVTFTGTAGGKDLTPVNVSVEITAGAPAAFALNLGPAQKNEAPAPPAEGSKR